MLREKCTHIWNRHCRQEEVMVHDPQYMQCFTANMLGGMYIDFFNPLVGLQVYKILLTGIRFPWTNTGIPPWGLGSRGRRWLPFICDIISQKCQEVPHQVLPFWKAHSLPSSWVVCISQLNTRWWCLRVGKPWNLILSPGAISSAAQARRSAEAAL